MPTSSRKDRTIATHAGNHPFENDGVINPPIYKASTILFERVDNIAERHRARFDVNYYGRYGTQTSRALREAFCALEGSESAIILPTGLGAVSAALLSFLRPGDHLLMVDSAYEPTRAICNRLLANFGIATTYYDPMVGSAIDGLIQPNTRVVYLESPGSLTFEVQDTAAIARAAKARGCIVVLDNTWATPLYFKPPVHGVDVSVYAATKYICGHSDMMMGIITAKREHHARISYMALCMLGHAVSADECYMALRGLRTLHARLTQHQETAIRLAHWLEARPEVERVFHPALPGSAGHQNWQRDFAGASGLFSVVLKPRPKQSVAAMLEGYEYFKMGFSWGGYESLAILEDPRPVRSATRWPYQGELIRYHAGLEDPDDLIADLAAGFVRLGKE